MNNMRTINLGDFKRKEIKILSGRQNGEIIRKKVKLDDEDRTKGIIKIIVPQDVFSLNSSYFLGLFGDSVRKLGEIGFKEKYQFECADAIKINIANGIKYALKGMNALGGTDEKKD